MRTEADPLSQGGHGQSHLIYGCLKILLVNHDLVPCVHSELCGVMKQKLVKPLYGGATMAQLSSGAGSGKAVSSPCHPSQCLDSEQ